jgi:hypothetical protein
MSFTAFFANAICHFMLFSAVFVVFWACPVGRCCRAALISLPPAVAFLSAIALSDGGSEGGAPVADRMELWFNPGKNLSL